MDFITSTQLYWFTRLDGINILCTIILVIGLIATIFTSCLTLASSSIFDYDKPLHAAARKAAIICSIITFISLCGELFIPTSKDLMIIVGVPKIVNNSQVQSIGTNSLAVVENGLKYVQEILKEKENK